jgi:hypothetical protein
MRVRRTLRSIGIAASLAAFTALTWATTIMAATGGADWPVKR